MVNWKKKTARSSMHDSESKGKIKNVVGFVKKNARNRIYYGLDKLNIWTGQ